MLQWMKLHHISQCFLHIQNLPTSICWFSKQFLRDFQNVLYNSSSQINSQQYFNFEFRNDIANMIFTTGISQWYFPKLLSQLHFSKITEAFANLLSQWHCQNYCHCSISKMNFTKDIHQNSCCSRISKIMAFTMALPKWYSLQRCQNDFHNSISKTSLPMALLQ